MRIKPFASGWDFLLGLAMSCFGLHIWVEALRDSSIINFYFATLRWALALLLVWFLFVLWVWRIFSPSCLFSCKLKNDHFPFVIEFQNISSELSRVLCMADPESCASSEEVSFRLVKFWESSGKLPWTKVFGTSLRAKLVEILWYFYKDFGLDKPKERNSLYFSWSNLMTSDSTMVPTRILVRLSHNFLIRDERTPQQSHQSFVGYEVDFINSLKRNYNKMVVRL